MNRTMSTAAVSAVSRQLQRIAADSSGRMKNRKNGLVVPVGRKGDGGEHRHVDAMGRDGEPRVEPPVVPGRRGDRQRGRGVQNQEGVGLRAAPRLAAIEPDGDEEQVMASITRPSAMTRPLWYLNRLMRAVSCSKKLPETARASV